MMSKNNNRIYLSPPHQSGKERDLINEVLDSNWLSSVGEHLNRFENELKELFQYPEVVAVSSGTAALHLILRNLGIKENDTVLVSSLTFIGGVSPIVQLGAKPVFIDSNENDWNISPELLLQYLEENKADPPKALIVVHLYGNPCNIQELKRICVEHGIVLIEDCAEALGAKVDGSYTGTFGDYAFLSINGNKTITTSGGGAIIAKTKEEKEYFIYLATQAKDKKQYYEHHELGYNYRLSNLLAALGLAQLADFSDRIRIKKEINVFYRQHLKELGFEFLSEKEGTKSSYWLTCALLPAEIDPLEIVRLMDQKYNIETRPVWKPMHLQPVFKGAKKVLNGVSESIFKKGICLPSGVSLSEKQLHFICTALKEIISR